MGSFSNLKQVIITRIVSGSDLRKYPGMVSGKGIGRIEDMAVIHRTRRVHDGKNL